MNMADYLLVNGRLVLPHEVLKNGALLVRRGRIQRVIEQGFSFSPDLPRYDARGAYVTPGLIELHIHGAGGVGFDDLGQGPGGDPASAVASLVAARGFLLAHGVTTFVPTLVARDAELNALSAAIVAAGFDEADVPGIYLEGPFIAPSRRGGIPLDAICDPDKSTLSRLIALGRGKVRLMAYAPELPGVGAVLDAMRAAGIIPCMGHSDCSLDRITLPEGKFGITHLFNAMSPFSHRQGEEGLAMLPFIHDGPFVELNADGVHVNSSALRASARTLDPGRLMLISDACVAAGLPPGEYSYLGRKIVSGADGVRYADSGVLMGSNRLAPDILRNWLREIGASVPVSVGALTRVPARFLGIDDRRGVIGEGLEARLVVWEGDFESVREVL